MLKTVIISGIATTALAVGAAPYVKAYTFERALLTRVADQFKDPDSVKFTQVRTLRLDGELYGACGYANGKNNFGAYVGARRFIVSQTLAPLFYPEATPLPEFPECWAE